MIAALLFITLITPDGRQVEIVPQEHKSIIKCESDKKATTKIMLAQPGGWKLHAIRCEPAVVASK